LTQGASPQWRNRPRHHLLLRPRDLVRALLRQKNQNSVFDLLRNIMSAETGFFLRRRGGLKRAATSARIPNYFFGDLSCFWLDF
jgi:hypothetical protein